MRTFFIALGSAILGVILGTLLLVFVAGAVFSNFASNLNKPAEQSDTMVLELDLRIPQADQAPISGLEALFGTPQGFIDTVMKLEAAAQDDRVKGVFVRGSEYSLGSARAEEVRAALQAVQASGKFVIAHTQGTFGGGPSSYRAISTADEVWMQTGTDIISTGVSFETLFLKDLLDNLSVKPEFEALYEYKNAVNMFQETDYTEPHRQAMTRLANEIWDISLTDIAGDRDLSVTQVRNALESGPLDTGAVLAAGLADQEGWPEEAREAAMARGGEDAQLTYISAYVPPAPPFQAPIIAIVGAQGEVVTGDAGGSLFSEGQGFASDTIASAILEAGQDEDVSAIVFRIDSPGGSPTASDQIWRAVKRVQTENNKPVVVSMASVAASGGYYAAAGADWIVANRATITGSIGIFGGKFGVNDALARLGINARSITVGGPFTGAFSTTEAFSDDQRVQVRAWLKRGYDRFVEVVSEGRSLSAEEVHERARGRVWSGEDALENRLIDELGGINAAITKAKELAEIDAGTEVRVLKYPLAPDGFAIGGPTLISSAQDLKALGELNDILSNPQIKTLLLELQAAQTLSIQARIPSYQER
ncbi:MAG: signal peptide peptidase SppA [Henriciella sp.]|nr:signal peptide peptidase SppA [Henriciella sp.]